ncbi:hypothetical protein Tco_1142260, partial [Tanacetum coccineum]
MGFSLTSLSSFQILLNELSNDIYGSYWYFRIPNKAYEPFSIVDKPDTGLIYLNIKDEKRVMCLMEIVKFCDVTLEKVLKEVKLKIFQSEPWKKSPLLGELDRDIIRAFERKITKRL